MPRGNGRGATGVQTASPRPAGLGSHRATNSFHSNFAHRTHFGSSNQIHPQPTTGGNGAAYRSDDDSASGPSFPERMPNAIFAIELQGLTPIFGWPGLHTEGQHVQTEQQKQLPDALDDLYSQEEWTKLCADVNHALDDNVCPPCPSICCIPFILLCVHWHCAAKQSGALKLIKLRENVRLAPFGLRWELAQPWWKKQGELWTLTWDDQRRAYENANPQRRKVSLEQPPLKYFSDVPGQPPTPVAATIGRPVTMHLALPPTGSRTRTCSHPQSAPPISTPSAPSHQQMPGPTDAAGEIQQPCTPHQVPSEPGIYIPQSSLEQDELPDSPAFAWAVPADPCSDRPSVLSHGQEEHTYVRSARHPTHLPEGPTAESMDSRDGT